MGKRTLIVLVALGLGAGAYYLTNFQGKPPTERPTYGDLIAVKLESGQPIQVKVRSCDLGMTRSQVILKVYGELTNLSRLDIPPRKFAFAVKEATGATFMDQSQTEKGDTSAYNSFTLKAGETREIVLKYLLLPSALQSSLELAALEIGERSQRLMRLKTGEPFPVKLTEGEWRAIQQARWTP